MIITQRKRVPTRYRCKRPRTEVSQLWSSFVSNPNTIFSGICLELCGQDGQLGATVIDVADDFWTGMLCCRNDA